MLTGLVKSFLMLGFSQQVIAHLEDDTVGGLEASVTRMLEADPNFRKYFIHFLIFNSHFIAKSICYC